MKTVISLISFRITFYRFSYPCAKVRNASDVEKSTSVLCGQLLLKKTDLIYHKLCLSPRLFFVCYARAYIVHWFVCSYVVSTRKQ